MRPKRFDLALSLAVAGLAAVAIAAAAFGALGAGNVDVHIRHSRFEPADFELRSGQVVTFVITNTDPIDHEFIVGDEAVQARHELGTEPYHGSIPTEVSVPAGETVRTTVAFPQPEKLIIGCHLPGHYRYGMRASIVVR